MPPKSAAKVKQELLTPRPVFDRRSLLSSGSTLLNLACTDDESGAYPIGKDILIAGHSDTGKTVLAYSCLAEACNNPIFNDYRLIIDDSEDSDTLAKAAFLGPAVQERMEPPRGTIEYPEPTETVEDFYYVLDNLFKKGDPFIYIKDSETSLRSEADDRKFEENKGLAEKGKEAVGSYGDGKAIVHARNLRRVRTNLVKNNCILIMISHLNDNIGFGSQFSPFRRPGGKAMKYFATIEIWLTGSTDLKTKSARYNTELKVGILAKLDIKKNHFTGKKRQVTLPIYTAHGIDDLGANIDFLVEKGAWQEGHYDKNDNWAAGKPKGKSVIINAVDIGLTGSRNQLIKAIEDENKEKMVASVVSDVWMDIEEACAPHRKPRYG